MITFDTPYEGVIKQSVSEGRIAIKLQDASIESEKIKHLSSKYIKSLIITPMDGYTKIIASVPSSVNLQASKTSDAYGLRLRFVTSTAEKTNAGLSTKEEISPSLSLLPTKKDDDLKQSYYIVIAILIIGIILLFFIKKKITPSETKKQQQSWLFKETKETEKEVAAQTQKSDTVSIRFQKSINNENSVVMLDFVEQSYLVLVGKNNILLDRFTDNKPVTQDDFENILQSRHKELNDFLHAEEEIKEPLDAYKERAASISHEV